MENIKLSEKLAKDFRERLRSIVKLKEENAQDKIAASEIIGHYHGLKTAFIIYASYLAKKRSTKDDFEKNFRVVMDSIFATSISNLEKIDSVYTKLKEEKYENK